MVKVTSRLGDVEHELSDICDISITNNRGVLIPSPLVDSMAVGNRENVTSTSPRVRLGMLYQRTLEKSQKKPRYMRMTFFFTGNSATEPWTWIEYIPAVVELA
jgi:hypothetical protein